MKRQAPAALRNRDPILGVLREELGEARRVLEVASGTGEHAAYFARHLSALVWQPTDADPDALASIQAHRQDVDLPNLLPPMQLDVRSEPWSVADFDAVVCINMIHIAPFEACAALFEGAGRVLSARQPVITYGPYRFEGAFTSPSNQDFDRSLRGRDPSWGVRDTRDIDRVARDAGLERERSIALPANNHALVFRKLG